MRNQSIAGRQQLVRLLILAALLLGLSPRPAHAEGDMAAQTFAVNIATDGADAAVGNGICDVDLATAGAQCTLRAAIQEANATAAADTVTLGGRHYQLSLAGANEENALTGDLDIKNNLTINGEFGSTVVDGGSLDRVFAVLLGANVTIRNVTIQNGAADNGAGVLVDIGGTLALERSTVRDNVANADSGGGIYNAQGTLTLVQSTLTGNYAPYGGAIFNRGALTVQNSTLFDNDAYRGGALNTNSSSATLIVNSTISGNRASDGGALYVQSGVVTLNNATLTGNHAQDGEGGGIHGAATAANTLIAGNLGAKPDCAGTLTTLGYNLIGVGSGCAGPVNGLLGDQVGSAGAPIDPLLGPLQDNGAFLLTHALLPGSPALNAGNPAVPNGVGSACMATDQRGLARPGGVRCDIGAYEEISHFTVTSLQDLAELTPGDGVCEAKLLGAVVGCTLRAAIQEANLMAGMQIVDLPAGVYTLQRISADENDAFTGDLDIKQDLVIRGAGAANTTIATTAIWIDRIFETQGSVVIAGVTMTGGNSGSGDGGAIRVTGVLTLRDSVISNNRTDGDGGAIYFQGWVLTLERTTLTGNQADFGGAIFASGGALAAQASTIVSNTAGFGGGIYAGNTQVSIDASAILSNSATSSGGGGIDIGNERLLVRNSVISGNQAEDRGGGIHTNNTDLVIFASTISDNSSYMGGGLFFDNDGVDSLTNVTISGNRARESGGGLMNNGAEVTLNNVTIANNTADSDNNGEGEGGGLRNSGGATLKLMNSLVAGNSNVTNGKPDCSGAIISLGYSLIQNTAGCTFTVATGDITGQDAKLGPLQLNFTAMPTHALLPGSPAIDAGAPFLEQNTPCAAFDQRGLNRTDGNGDGVIRCDMGAYEAPTGQPIQAGFKLHLPLIVR